MCWTVALRRLVHTTWRGGRRQLQTGCHSDESRNVDAAGKTQVLGFFAWEQALVRRRNREIQRPYDVAQAQAIKVQAVRRNPDLHAE